MQTIEFRSGGSETIRGVLFQPSSTGPHPTILFAHGLLSSHAEFGDYPARFSQRGYLTLAIDFRGHGASEGMRGLISSDRMVQDLQSALDYVESRAGIDRHRIALFGHSLGGDAVICTAARDPRVAALVAGATVGRLQDEIGGLEYGLYRVVDAVNQVQKRITHRSLYVPYRVSYKDIFNDPQSSRAAEAANFLQKSIPGDNIPLLLSQDTVACARNVKVPALVVQGEYDRVVSHASTHSVYEALPVQDKEWYQVQGSGHSVWMDWKGIEAFEHIAQWLDKHLKL